MKFLTGTILGLLFLSGCSEQPTYIQHDTLSRIVSDALTKSVGLRPDSLTCPADLPSIVGSSTRCTLESGGTRYGVTVRVTQVPDPGRPEMDQIDYEVDQRPQ